MPWGRKIGVACTAGLALLTQCAVAPGLAQSSNRENTGRTPNGTFYIDFTRGYDRVNHILANWDVDREWLATSYRSANASFAGNGMTLVTVPDKTSIAGYSSAEFQRNGIFGYGRYEVVVRASDAAGAVTAFFTYAGEDTGEPHDEIDVELLGRSPRSVHLNYFSRGKSNPVDIDLWFDASRDFHLYAIEWRPDSIIWFVDGVQIRRVTDGPGTIGIPSRSGRVMASVWAGNGKVTEWVGAADFSRGAATYRCMSHNPLGQRARQCSDSFEPKPQPR